MFFMGLVSCPLLTDVFLPKNSMFCITGSFCPSWLLPGLTYLYNETGGGGLCD